MLNIRALIVGIGFGVLYSSNYFIVIRNPKIRWAIQVIVEAPMLGLLLRCLDSHGIRFGGFAV